MGNISQIATDLVHWNSELLNGKMANVLCGTATKYRQYGAEVYNTNTIKASGHRHLKLGAQSLVITPDLHFFVHIEWWLNKAINIVVNIYEVH